MALGADGDGHLPALVPIEKRGRFTFHSRAANAAGRYVVGRGRIKEVHRGLGVTAHRWASIPDSHHPSLSVFWESERYCSTTNFHTEVTGILEVGQIGGRACTSALP